MARERVAARVGGTVQGVGFRPFAYRLATELELGGHVRNGAGGALVEVEGESERVAEFLRRLRSEAPPLAAVEAIEPSAVAVRGEREFRIVASDADAPFAPVPPDVATCDACLAELFDPGDRRHRYPFLNCTDCGPRFTIVRAAPYDRPATTMAEFEMCAECRAEYEDPGDRRFHAQPNACPRCGPRAELVGPGGEPLGLGGVPDAVAAAAALLRAGAIVAVKGVGGYHLACLAGDEEAVAELRRRKLRETKPFAILAADLTAARELVELSDEEERLLSGRERPILIARRRLGAAVADSVAPSCADLGAMLPHSPLHHLLIADAGASLVLTSGNRSGEPITADDDEALARLGPVADAFLRHDRPIAAVAEDSVARALDPGLRRAPLIMRRARGYVPSGLGLSPPAPRPLLACGAELKSTFCFAAGGRAWVSPHLGDLGDLDSLAAFKRGIDHFERLLEIEPELLAHDLHPDYASTRYALEREGAETLAIQHHHAHLAAVLAEHGHAGPAVGAIFDGAGLGPDGTVWGGEILVGDAASYERVGALLPVPQPGGDAAAREPWRMACAWLAAAFEQPQPELPSTLRDEVTEAEWEVVAALCRAPATPTTTSAGRLFDAVAALTGLRARIGHEGQAAMELEAEARPDERAAYPFELREGSFGADETTDPTEESSAPIKVSSTLVLDPRPAIRAIAADLDAGADTGAISARFHSGLAKATAAACTTAAEGRNLDTVALSGGVFQNRLLLERTTTSLRTAGLNPLLPEQLPPNDGAISYGQAAVTAARAE
ncbi:MAG TPA: carbamoyltransferase HypF [Thermoanaerobaculia bacterium]|nr:carbamoyltransferase HypF [Thermoanaerobaculia bacterium]